MIKIAICDDEVIYTDLISSCVIRIFEDNNLEADVTTINNGNEMIKMSREKDFDAIMLDIDMPQINGIEVAEQIRDFNQNIDIIFITNKSELVFKAIHYSPLRFIRKNMIDVEIEEATKEVIKRYNSNNKFIKLLDGSDVEVLKINDIYYTETNKRNIFIHLKNKTVKAMGSINYYDNILKSFSFTPIHYSFRVNLKYVAKMKDYTVYMTNGEELKSSRAFFQKAKDEFLEYLRRKADGCV